MQRLLQRIHHTTDDFSRTVGTRPGCLLPTLPSNFRDFSVLHFNTAWKGTRQQAIDSHMCMHLLTTVMNLRSPYSSAAKKVIWC